jgi:hypothetical protein
LTAAAAVGPAESAGDASRDSLRATYQRVAGFLAKSPFGQPLYLEADDGDRQLTGHAYALLSHGMGDASKPALRSGPVVRHPAAAVQHEAL